MDNQTTIIRPQSSTEPQTELQPEPPKTPLLTSPKTKHSKTPLVFLLMLLVLAAGVAGTYMWQHKKVNNLQTELNTANTRLASPPKISANSSQKFLYLYDYGLKIPLSSGLQDLYYVDYNSATGNVLSFSTQALVNKDLGCLAEPAGSYEFFYQPNTLSPKPTQQAVTGSPFGLITITSKALPASQVGDTDQQTGSLEAHVNGYYLYYKTPQAGCSSNTATDNLLLQQKDLFVSAIKNTEAI